MRLRSSLLAAFAVVVGACGGSAPEPKSAASPGGPSSTATAPPAQAQKAAQGGMHESPGNEGDAMWDAFQRDRLQLDASNDCPTACRALGSMDRSAGMVCTLSGRPTSSHCEDAKSAVRSARSRVHDKCGVCPGVSTTASDPVPQTPPAN